jgi:hypothetical protein
VQEEQAPVAGGDRFRDRHAQLLRIVERFVELAQRLGAHAIDFRGGDGLRLDTLDRRDERVACCGERIGRRHLRPEDDVARIVQHEIPRLDRGGLLRLDERAYSRPAGSTVITSPSASIAIASGCAGHGVVERGDELRSSDATNGDRALAILHRFQRVQRRQRACGLRNRAERLRNLRERAIGIEPSCHDQHGVIGLVVQLVERLQPRDIDVLDVRARADREVAVVVPVVRRCRQPAPEDALRTVFAAFVFVAHHGHLGVEVLFRDERIDHPVASIASAQSRISSEAVNDSK